MRLGSDEQFFGLGKLGRIDRVERVAEGLQRGPDGGELVVMHHCPAREAGLCEVEEFLPGRRGYSAPKGCIHCKAGRAPVLRHGIDLAVDRAGTGKALVEGGTVVVRDAGEVERFDQVLLDIGGDGVVRRHEDIPARPTGLQLRKHLFVRAEDIGLHCRPGLGREGLEVGGVVVVWPGRKDYPVANPLGQCRAGDEARHRRPKDGACCAKAGHAEEVPTGDRALLVTAQLFHELLTRDVVDLVGHC